MLKALLHRKLRRATAMVDEDDDVEDAVPEDVTAREDPLTSTVFERFAYLPSDISWEILRCASKPLGDGPALPVNPPRGAPSWSFWPGLRPGVEARNTRRVEPDVVISWDDTLLVIEAKHRGVQVPAQWAEQIRALRADPWYGTKRMWLLAVGGIQAREGDEHLARVRAELPLDLPGLLWMRWEDLGEVIERLDVSSLPPAASSVLADVAMALEAWGYRRKTWFSTLPTVAARLHGEEAISTLEYWRIR